MSIEIVDSHQHFWHPGLIDIPWLSGKTASFGDPSQLRHLYVPADYRRDAGPLKVLATVHVEAAARPEYALLESVWATGIADAEGLPSAIVAYADVEDPKLEATLEALGRSPWLRGIRMRLNFDAASGRRIARSAEVMQGAAFRDGLRMIAARGLVFNLSIFSSQLPMAAELAAAVPEAVLVLEHIGWPVSGEPEAFREWQAGMKLLSACPNVFVKISGFWAIDKAWRPEIIAPWVKEAFAFFGPKRCLFGSNFPIEKLMCPLPKQVEILSGILAAETAGDRRDFFVENAARVYRLQLHAAG